MLQGCGAYAAGLWSICARRLEHIWVLTTFRLISSNLLIIFIPIWQSVKSLNWWRIFQMFNLLNSLRKLSLIDPDSIFKRWGCDWEIPVNSFPWKKSPLVASPPGTRGDFLNVGKSPRILQWGSSSLPGTRGEFFQGGGIFSRISVDPQQFQTGRSVLYFTL